MTTVKDALIQLLLRILVILIYVVSHVYDYISYPIYFFYYHPWLVRRYKREKHAHKEVHKDSMIFHSLQQPSELNIMMECNELITMEKVFNFLSEKHGNRECLGTREILAEEDEVQPNGKIFKKYVLGKYEWKSFEDFCSEAKKVSWGFHKLGLKEKDRIAILSETRAEWIISAFGAFKSNITIVTIYTTLGNDGIIHAINETEVSCLICSHETWPKVQSILPKCPKLKNIVFFGPPLEGMMKKVDLQNIPSSVKVVPLKSILDVPECKDTPFSPPTPDDCAIIMYTSGSTGTPKGVILTHENLICAMSALANIGDFKPKDRYVGYLPLAHVLELLAETVCLLYGIKIGYSSAQTLTNKSSKVKHGCKGDVNLLRPTLLCAVPLILERIYKSIVDTMKRQGWAAEELFHYFVNYKMKWQDRGFDTPLLNKTLFRKIRYFLGGRVRLMLSGGAPLSPDTHSLTRTCICIPLVQGYGLTETTACATVTSPHDRTTGRAGAPLLNVKVKLVNWCEGGYMITDKPYPRGEIHIGGKNVALGYFKNEEKTKEDFYYDDNGTRWFRTGDIGEVYQDGVLKIVDRKKDLVKLQNGEYVSFGKVESVLKTCHLVDNICLHADSSKDYIMAIIVPSPTALAYLSDKPAAEAILDEKLCKIFLKEIQEYGCKFGLSRVELPLKILLTMDEWTPESGLVTAAFKIRRLFIIKKYNSHIEKIYT